MKTVFRWCAATALAAIAVRTPALGPAGLAAALAAGIAVHGMLRTRPRAMFVASLPVVLFGVVLVVLQWIAGGVDLRLPLRVMAIFALSTALFRLIPLPGLRRLEPGARLRTPFLFLLFVRHFSLVLMTEVKRTFQARALCIHSNFGRGGFYSLVCATAAVFRRSLDRAERFYAARLIGGFDE